MAQVINTNIASLNTQRQLNKTNSALSTSIERLSSGLRINSSKDDAAGLAIATRMTSQINGSNQASRNANDAISLAQTTESSLGEITNMLQRMRQLAVQSANGTNTSGDRTALQSEFSSLQTEIGRTIGSTSFNGLSVLAGGASGIQFQVGANANQVISVTISGLSLGVLGISGASIGGSTRTAASGAMSDIDDALTQINTIRANLGAVQNRFESVIANLSSQSENLSAARGRIMDADFASETADLTRAQILQQAGTAMLAQANTIPQNVLSLLRG